MGTNRHTYSSWASLAAIGVACLGGLCSAGGAELAPSEEFSLGLPYTLAIEGVADKGMRAAIREVSSCYRLRDRPPVTVGQARWRLQRDYEPITTLLQDRGYLAASVTGRVDATVTPMLLTAEVELGPPYQLTDLDITWQGEKPQLDAPEQLAQLGMNKRATAKTVGEVIDELGRMLIRNGYPFAANSAPTMAMIEGEPGGARLSVTIEAGPRYRFGPMTIEGLVERSPRVVTKRVPWNEGATFDLAELAHLEKVLMQTGLFSIVRVKPAPTATNSTEKAVEPDALLPVHVQVTERKARTVRIGVSYETDEGFGGKLDWTHRDIFGGGETFSLSVRGTELGYSGNAKIVLPSSRLRGVKYFLQGVARNDRYDAYNAQTLEFVPGAEWARIRGVKLRGGLRWKRGDTEQLSEERRYFAWSVPLSLLFDFTNDLLDPRDGIRFDVTTIPTSEEGGSGTEFLKSMFSLRTYWTPVHGKRPLTLALRGNLGTIVGASHDDVFVDERFYAGGGGSVRGYDFQTIGPTVDGVPVGGRSIIEGSGELRAVFTERWGGVLFIDGGMAYASEVPDGSHDLLWSAGFGVRIFTPIGPARFDLAFPLNPREIDENMMFYISLGQAF